MTYHEVRWKQRFQNFTRTFKLLEESLLIETPSVVERAGIIQFYEMTFEQSWKVLKDYLEEEGFEVKSPRDAIKLAVQYNIIADGQVWLEALKDRNLTTHTYDENTANKVESLIKTIYYPFLRSLHRDLTKKLTE